VRLSWFLGLFFFSGFCGLVYEIVWLRLAMGVFGVTAPLVSLFLSVFMGALGLGSWLGGRLCRRLAARSAGAMLRLYAGAELLLGVSAAAVPLLLDADRRLLSGALGSMGWGSAGFYAASAALIAVTLAPWCACMGLTYPFAMAAIRKSSAAPSEDSFSFLYLANVIGAAAGTLLSAYALIEWLGFRGTLAAAAGLNALIAATALVLSLSPAMAAGGGRRAPAPPAAPRGGSSRVLSLLFVTGFVSMGMEVVWMRQFTPYVGTTIYAFAIVLAVYLAAAFLGSCAYRAALRRGLVNEDLAWLAAGALALLALPFADPFLAPSSMLGVSVETGKILRVVAGIGPFCALLGFLTPSLVDRWSGGDPERAGTAYAVNVLGCVLGPLFAGFCLLPFMPERLALGVVSLPLFGAGWAAARRRRAPLLLGAGAVPVFALVALIAAVLPFSSSTFEEGMSIYYRKTEIRRDYQATVVASPGRERPFLYVNGVGMTALSPVTKYMAHLPLAFLARPPKKALVICFGMGTTFRSLVSWGVDATAVELVPSVPRVFGVFHADADRVLAAPNGRVVIDDGRRFLARSRESYDVITIDPAPPMEAAGTGYLFSQEFYALIGRRLAPDGILQQWIVEPIDPVTMAAFVGAVRSSFPYVRAFRSIADQGYHLLASRRPIPSATAAELARRLPPAAAADLVEFGPGKTAARQFQLALDREVPAESVAPARARPLTDDRPVNEYYFLRRTLPVLAPPLGL
jgi:spermidine synthase